MVILFVVQLGDSSLSFLPYAKNIIAHHGRDHDCQTPKDEYSCLVESRRPFIEWIKCKYRPKQCTQWSSYCWHNSGIDRALPMSSQKKLEEQVETVSKNIHPRCQYHVLTAGFNTEMACNSYREFLSELFNWVSLQMFWQFLDFLTFKQIAPDNSISL